MNPAAVTYHKNSRRAFFLETVNKLEPKVLKDLYQEPLRFFSNTRLANPNVPAYVHLDTWELLTSEHWHQVRDFGAPLLLFRQKLWDWGQRWKLDEEWCLRAAYHTLIDWGPPDI